jgi:hypothetical protein
LNQIEGLRRSAEPPGEFVVLSMDIDKPLLPNADFPIRVIHQPSDGLPLAQARNRAAAAASFDKLLFLDVDCIPMRGLLGAACSALERFDGLLCAEIRYLAAGETSAGWNESELRRAAVRHKLRQFPPYGLRVEPNPGLFWSLAFAMHRARFEVLGGFDETFTGYGAEDTDFGFRAARAGLSLGFLGGPGAFHQHHTVFDPPLQHFSDIVRNAKHFYDIHRHWPMLGWLDAFTTLGLINIEGSDIRILREPSRAELEAARTRHSARF